MAIPKVYVLPFIEILDGVDDESDAVPPLIESAKSEVSKAPDPPFVLKTASLKVTFMDKLSSDTVVSVIAGLSIISLTFLVLALA